MSLKNAGQQCTQVVCDQAAREQKSKESLAERDIKQLNVYLAETI